MKNKAILVIDMPKSCIECKLNYEYYSCIITGTKFWNIKDDFDPETQILPNCPLSLLPERINLCQYVENGAVGLDGIVKYQYAQGWNDFREEILGLGVQNNET